MDCCGHHHALTRRRWMWSTLTSVAAMVGGGLEPRGSTAAAQTAETAAAALDVLRNSISVDVHTHGGTTGITSNGAAQRRPREGDAGGIAGGRLPRGRTGRSHSCQE